MTGRWVVPSAGGAPRSVHGLRIYDLPLTAMTGDMDNWFERFSSTSEFLVPHPIGIILTKWIVHLQKKTTLTGQPVREGWSR